MKRIILAILIVVLIILIFFTDFFIEKNSLVRFFSSIGNYAKTDLYQENNLLKIENENLKAQLQKFQIFYSENTPLNDMGKNYLPTRIFSTYPFNVKNILTVDKGADDNISKDSVVVVNKDIFLGQVSDVSKKSSIFDPNWQLPIKIGENKVNGLFKGGNDPRITLIEKSVKIGDGVFLVSKDFPLYLKIGDIRQIDESTGGVFKEASIQVPYNLGELETVYILTQLEVR
jgi:cell shape-determining protein MreC